MHKKYLHSSAFRVDHIDLNNAAEEVTHSTLTG